LARKEYNPYQTIFSNLVGVITQTPMLSSTIDFTPSLPTLWEDISGESESQGGRRAWMRALDALTSN